MDRNIIALGGGGFSMEPENPLLDTYILEISGKKKPKICFIPTASGDSQDYKDRFYNFFKNFNCITSDLSLFRTKINDMEAFLLEQDIIYVGGGNTRNMLLLWKDWGIDKILKKAYEKGILLCGISAGAICWFEEGLTDSIPNQLNKWDSLGFLKGSCSPHFDGEINRKPIFLDLIKKGKMKEGLGIDDSCAVHFKNEEIFKIVSSKNTAKAYKVTENSFYELETQFLGV
ncbi:MAG: peptidase E [Candidatus Sericytochromatia bacterium]